MKSYKWQKNGAWLSTITAIIPVPFAFTYPHILWFSFGVLSTAWITVLDHKYGNDSHQKAKETK